MIILRLDRMLAERKISSKELAERVGISQVNMSRIKTGKVSAIRFSTLDAICRALDCQPGDVLEYMPDDDRHHPRHYLEASTLSYTAGPCSPAA